MAAPKKILSALEVENKIAMGLCLICDESFTVDHAMKHKGIRLVVIEMDEEDASKFRKLLEIHKSQQSF
ncbi:hypothetical protein L195_g029203 [Trifolium pratense]|uniref:Uncharacterized protein n=1 Tax=Trifolium pratense TaxID=57577 RepID=A0A2K3L454_TRIPR|nr:hypothetical protein L195_g029203 [Trifolium pratense]